MDLSPLTLVMLLMYGLLIAASLTAWAALTVGRRGDGTEHERRREADRQRKRVRNDDVRGAKAQPQTAAQSSARRRGDDPFERFLRSNDDTDLG